MHVQRQMAASVRSYAAASALREAMPYPLSAVQQAVVDDKLLVSREALGMLPMPPLGHREKRTAR